jgi:hypothetical protein
VDSRRLPESLKEKGGKIMSSISTSDETSTFDWAVAYSRLGWSVIPIIKGTKKPALGSWKPFSVKAPTPEELREWFEEEDDVGIAVCLGAVSGDLVCRDFDDFDAYLRWATEHFDLAIALPMVGTSRGCHVYFRVKAGAVEAASPNGASIIDYGDGELRGGGIAVLPPSTHQSGHVYRWLQELEEEVPLVEDLEEAGLAQSWAYEAVPSAEPDDACEADGLTEEDRENKRELRSTEEGQGRGGEAETDTGDRFPEDFSLAPWAEKIVDAIDATQPAKEGQRNKLIFELARTLKGIPPLGEMAPWRFYNAVKVWHETAQHVIGTQSFEETFSDFVRGWGKVMFPVGDSPLRALYTQALAEPFPKCAEHVETEEVRKLVALGKRLHNHWAPEPFPLACRSVGELLGVSYVTASKWLHFLVQVGLLEEVSKGRQKGCKASRYRYLGD